MVRVGAKNREERKNKIGLTGFVLLFIFLTLFCPIVAKNDFNATAKSQGQGFVLIETSSNRVLKAGIEHARLPMASTTKIMTALIAIERLNLDDLVTIPKEAVGVEGSSIYLTLGEKISVLDLLYGLMLRSGNDSAMAIAIHTAGSVSKFVELMNEKAKQLGLKNTSFKNPH
ncbi:MAG: D-alanyl-D-alanine carboxypeptidase, partial [Clostridia bacterium]|nr:D-alanyl-D-alanine carboxypeptidase [Clostridia bacterium]